MDTIIMDTIIVEFRPPRMYAKKVKERDEIIRQVVLQAPLGATRSIVILAMDSSICEQKRLAYKRQRLETPFDSHL
ncbi:hypothetical protein PG987_014843 [Apiospora arundinis]